jgi:AcrR family transcriptional regulator
MKSYDSRTYSINDFVEWDAARQLELNPQFQRRPVWTDKAKSYLIDTILRGKPIPKIFIRQKINVTTKTSIREVVDGQQRLRTILSFIKDGFVVSKRHHPEYGGLLFSQLPEPVQAQVLAYEVSVDLLINLPDPEVLDIFSRLNSYAVILNEQEKINADHFGPFKALSDKIGHKYYHYWTDEDILTPKSIVRMQEVNLVADLLIAMIEGIKSKKQIKKFYDLYETSFDKDVDLLEQRFDAVIAKISDLYPEGLSNTEFRRQHLFYSLFTAVAHCLFGLPHLPAHPNPLTGPALQAARNSLDRVQEIFQVDDIALLTRQEQQFIEDSRRATTDEKVRERRTSFLLNLIG